MHVRAAVCASFAASVRSWFGKGIGKNTSAFFVLNYVIGGVKNRRA